MNTNYTHNQNHVIPITRRSIQRIRDYKKIVCEKGVLWLTLSGDRKDYILLAGDQFANKKRGKVLVEAMRDAVMRVD